MADAFKPEGTNVKVTVSSAASSGTKLTDNPDTVRIANIGTAVVWVKFGASSTVAATTSDYPVPASFTETIRLPVQSGPVFLSVIAAGSTGDIYFTPGSGL